MPVQQRAVIVIDEKRNHQTVRDLREALTKLSLREPLCTTSVRDVANMIYANQWPIVFVDHDEEHFDGIRHFERLFRSLGNQFFHYFLLVPSGEKNLRRCYRSLGLSGVLRKPIQLFEVADVVSPFVVKPNEFHMKNAHDFASAVLKKQFHLTEEPLKSLLLSPTYKEKVELVRAFLNDSQGSAAKVLNAFPKLLKEQNLELRVLSDYAHFLRKYSIYTQCAAVYKKIREINPKLTSKIWEEILFLSEVEMLNEIAPLLEKLSEDEMQLEATDSLLARMMQVMNLEKHVPQLLTTHALEQSAYQAFLKREKDKAEKAAAAAALKKSS